MQNNANEKASKQPLTAETATKTAKTNPDPPAKTTITIKLHKTRHISPRQFKPWHVEKPSRHYFLSPPKTNRPPEKAEGAKTGNQTKVFV